MPHIVSAIIHEPHATPDRQPIRLTLEPATCDRIGAAGDIPVVQIRVPPHERAAG